MGKQEESVGEEQKVEEDKVVWCWKEETRRRRKDVTIGDGTEKQRWDEAESCDWRYVGDDEKNEWSTRLCRPLLS